MKKEVTTAASGKIWISRQFSKGKEVAHQDKLEARCFEVEPAYVKASYGLTINLGNYESARCDAGVTLPCYVEEIEDAFKEAWKIAETHVQQQVAEVMQEHGKR